MCTLTIIYNTGSAVRPNNTVIIVESLIVLKSTTDQVVITSEERGLALNSKKNKSITIIKSKQRNKVTD